MAYPLEPHEHFRIHFVRSRFKKHLEDNLISLSTAFIKKRKWATKDTTKIFLPEFQQLRPDLTEKAIRNFITESNSLFSLTETAYGESSAGKNAILLADDQNLPDFFLRFASRFQFPGGHVKDKYNAELVANGVRFKPAKFLVELILSAHNHEMDRSGVAFGISSLEATWFALSDLLVLQGKREPEESAQRLLKFREKDLDLVIPDLGLYKLPIGIKTSPGDFVRYSRDCLNWLCHARVLIQNDGRWYLRHGSMKRIAYLLDDDSFFDDYSYSSVEDFPLIQDSWLSYANNFLDFSHDTTINSSKSITKLSLIEIPKIKETSLDRIIDEIASHSGENLSNQEIGDQGERIVIQHEKTKLKLAGLDDLAMEVKKIPDHLAIGYDIDSFDLDGKAIHIEVKSTMGINPSNVNRFKMTPNEWVKAEEIGISYFVYRVLLADENGVKLFSLPNPVKLYKNDKIDMRPSDGAYVSFQDINKIGKEIELLY